MSSLQLEQALRDSDRRREACHAIADRLMPFAFGLPASADLKDLLQSRPIGVALEFGGVPNTVDVYTPVVIHRFLSVLLRYAQYPISCSYYRCGWRKTTAQ